MTAPELTLKAIRKSLPKEEVATYRVSDFLTDKEKKQREQARANRKAQKSKRKWFTKSDAIVAEMIARFGYNFYQAWNIGEIEEDFAYRMLYAERAREAANRIKLESALIPVIKDCIRRQKGEKKPTGPKEASKVIKTEIKVAMGEA